MNVDITRSLLSMNIHASCKSSCICEKKRKERQRRLDSSLSTSDYFLRPVRRAAMLPTFLPGGACLLTVVGLPGD